MITQRNSEKISSVENLNPIQSLKELVEYFQIQNEGNKRNKTILGRMRRSGSKIQCFQGSMVLFSQRKNIMQHEMQHKLQICASVESRRLHLLAIGNFPRL